MNFLETLPEEKLRVDYRMFGALSKGLSSLYFFLRSLPNENMHSLKNSQEFCVGTRTLRRRRVRRRTVRRQTVHRPDSSPTGQFADRTVRDEFSTPFHKNKTLIFTIKRDCNKIP